MAIKVNLPTIPTLAEVSLSDKVLIGSSHPEGLARLASLSVIRAVVGSVWSGSLINADDGYVYQLFGRLVDGEITISLVQMWSGAVAEGSGARINADDGHTYELVGHAVDGQITISAEQIE
jgi:hypothetical protein